MDIINGIFPAILVNNVTVISDCSHSQWWAGEPWENSGRKRTPTIYCSHSLQWAQKKPRLWKHRILASVSWSTYQRNDFSEPRILNLPILREVLHSLRFLVSLLSNNLLFPLPALYCKTPIYPSSPLAFSKQFSQGYKRCCLPGLKS